MSELPIKPTFTLKEGAEMAAMCFVALEPLVQRLVVCGSIRRGAMIVSDVEIVAEPYLKPDLFGVGEPDLDRIVQTCATIGTIVKQGQRYIRVIGIGGQPEAALDLFLCHPPAQWGSLVAIRTGPWQLGRYAVTKMKERGFKHDQGTVWDSNGKPLAVPTEKHFFHYAGLPFVPPEERTELARRVGAMNSP